MPNPATHAPEEGATTARADRRKSLIILNISVMMWAVTPLFADFIKLGPVHITCFRSVVAAIALGIFLSITKAPMLPKSRRGLGVLIVSGLLLCVHWITLFAAWQVSSVAVGIIALHTYPVMIALAEPILFKERFKAMDVVLAVVVFTGILVMLEKPSLDDPITQGVMFGVLSGLFYAIRTLISRRYIQSYSGSVLLFYQTTVVGIVLLPVTFALPAVYSGEMVWQFLILGAIFTAVPHTLNTMSLKHLSGKTNAIISTVLPLYAVILAMIVLGEFPEIRTYVGGGIILSAVIFETIKSLRA